MSLILVIIIIIIIKLSVLGGSNILELPDIIEAASLAHNGRLKSVEHLQLEDVDLSNVLHLASLTSSSSSYLVIKNVGNCDLTEVLESIKCNKLEITSQRLGREETQALVRAMESRLDEVEIGFSVARKHGPEDITALLTYSGQGKCGRLVINCDEDTAIKYLGAMEAWVKGNKEWRLMRQRRDRGEGLELVRECALKRKRESSYDRKVKEAKEKEKEKERAKKLKRKQKREKERAEQGK